MISVLATLMISCERPGATVPSLPLLIVTVFMVLAPPALGSEFGNFLNSKIEKQSREASAQALAGVEKIFVALRQRELGHIDEGRATLQQTVEAFKNAAAAVRAFRIDADADRKLDLSRVSPQDGSFLRVAAGRLGRPLPEKLSDLFGLFAVANDRMAAVLSEHIKDGAEPMYPRISEEVVFYLRVGSVVSVVARAHV